MQIVKVLKSKQNNPHNAHTQGSLISRNESHPGNQESTQTFSLHNDKPTGKYLE